jgi:hypothetical protein
MNNATLNQMIETARTTFAGATAATLAEYAQITMARIAPDAAFNNWEYGYVRKLDGSYHINTYQPSGFAFRLEFTFTETGMQVKYDISHQNRLIGELSLSHDVSPSGIALALTNALEIHLTGRVDYGRFN